MMLPYKLGRLEPTKAALEVPTFAAVHQAMGMLPAEPVAGPSWTRAISSAFDMLKNDEIGDCGMVGPAQIIRVTSANAGREIIPTAPAVVAEYSALSGYTPANPDSDVGLVLTDVLQKWKSDGLDIDGSGRKHKILGYLALNPKNRTELEWAINLFGAVLQGHTLTQLAMTDPVYWEVTPNKVDQTPVGRHCTAAFSFNVAGTDNVTWGQFRLARPAFDALFLDESYAVLTEDWALPDGIAPSGFSTGELEDRLKNQAALAA